MCGDSKRTKTDSEQEPVSWCTSSAAWGAKAGGWIRDERVTKGKSKKKEALSK